MTKDRIAALIKESEAAARKVRDALEERYPIGSNILVNINGNQKRPTGMTVCGYYQHTVRAKMLSTNSRCGWFVRDFSMNQIVN